MSALFLYGTLRHRPLVEALTGGTGGALVREAVLRGHRVVRQRDAPWPALVRDPRGEARGVVWTDLPPEARERLDGFEIPFGYEPETTIVEVEGRRLEAKAYMPPGDLEVSDEDWSLDRWIAAEGEAVMRIAREIAAHEPPLAGDPLRRQWAMIAHRAHATLRAAEAPTTLRHRAEAGDFALVPARPLEGQFFKLAGLEVSHRRFDGGRNEGLPREVMVGADASLVLPYDEARDRVLLVEQFRPGPARRGDPQPWVLEPVAGLVDAGETPEEAAIREAEEEAGLKLTELERMYAGYASPGNATDHFFAYLALCDLPDGFATTGGLAEEHEDLRLHVLPFGKAMALVESGEANAVPLISMMLWLDRWRARRRSGGLSPA